MFLQKKKYKHVHAIGISAGAMLAGAYQTNEFNTTHQNMRLDRVNKSFDSIVSICGLLVPSFYDKYLDHTFKFYIMRGTPNYESYTCSNLTTPMLVISAENEYLFSQSYHFISQNNKIPYKVYTALYLSHTFALSPQYEETI